MRAVVQRVSWARVRVDGNVVGEIPQGLLILLGVSQNDHWAEAAMLAEKISKLRIFSDSAGKMNLSLPDVDGAILVVSQFTLFADTRRGNRPSFTAAAEPRKARELYESFCQLLQQLGIPVATGVFAAEMEVELLNQGPVTILLDTDEM